MKSNFPEINMMKVEPTQRRLGVFEEREQTYRFPLDLLERRTEFENRVSFCDFLVIPQQSRRKLSE